MNRHLWQQYTGIPVKVQTKERVNKLKQSKDTFDEFINELINEHIDLKIGGLI